MSLWEAGPECVAPQADLARRVENSRDMALRVEKVAMFFSSEEPKEPPFFWEDLCDGAKKDYKTFLSSLREGVESMLCKDIGNSGVREEVIRIGVKSVQNCKATMSVTEDCYQSLPQAQVSLEKVAKRITVLGITPELLLGEKTYYTLGSASVCRATGALQRFKLGVQPLKAANESKALDGHFVKLQTLTRLQL